MKQDEFNVVSCAMIFYYFSYCTFRAFTRIHIPPIVTKLNDSHIVWVDVISSVSICSLCPDSDVLSTGFNQLQYCFVRKYNIRARYLNSGSLIMEHIAATKNRACTDSRSRNNLIYHLNGFKIYRANRTFD